MTFIYGKYLIPLLVVLGLLVLVLTISLRNYRTWISEHWGLKLKKRSLFSFLLLLVSLSFLLFSLLDLRGGETYIKSFMPDQKTIILLDASASMLAEDVRPNRFVKSLQLARHIVKSSAGHQFAIVVFSDIQKRIVPFTDDLELLDARLAALEDINNIRGGSNISIALNESVQYFKEEAKDDESYSGNILLFTDGEENGDEMKVSLGKEITLAVIGVGTSKGGPIPMRDRDGNFLAFKSYQGQQVNTVLDEHGLDVITNSARNGKAWIVNSYSLPTDEILAFLRSEHKAKFSNGNVSVRPVKAYLALVPFVLFYILYVLFSWGRHFTALVLIFMIGQVHAEALKNELGEVKEELKSGKASRKTVLKNAEKLLRANKTKEAATLYEEYARDNDSKETRLNYGTSLFQNQKMNEAIEVYKSLLNDSTIKDEAFKNKVRSNLVNAIKVQQQQQNQKQNQDKKQQEQKQQDDQQQGQQGSQGQSDQNEKKDQKSGQGGEKQKEDKSQGDQKKQDDKKDSKKDSNEAKENKDEKNNKANKTDKIDAKAESQSEPEKSLEQKEDEIKQKRRQTKIPAEVKQLLDDDRELQKRLLDTSTRNKDKQNDQDKKDW